MDTVQGCADSLTQSLVGLHQMSHSAVCQSEHRAEQVDGGEVLLQVSAAGASCVLLLLLLLLCALCTSSMPSCCQADVTSRMMPLGLLCTCVMPGLGWLNDGAAWPVCGAGPNSVPAVLSRWF